MSAAALLARLTASGCRVTLRPDGRVSLRPAPAPELLAEARQHRDELARLVAATAYASAGTLEPETETAPPAATTPETEASSEPPPPKPPRRYRPGAPPGDPPAPIVEPEATRTLVILELAGAGPELRPDGTLAVAHPEFVSPETRAAATLHQDDIVAILEHRAELERLFPVSAEPLTPKGTRP